LCESSYKPLLVVTAPDKPAGRGYGMTPPEVKEAAAHHGIPVFQPEKLDEQFAQQLRGEEWDVFIVAAYGKIIPQCILEIPAKGTLNVHGSLLPKYRGSSPIQTAIANGDATTGATIMLIDERMDHGPLIAQKEFPIAKEATSGTLFVKMAEEGARLLVETLPRWLSGEQKAIAQNHEKATTTSMLSKEDGRIDWTKSAVELERLVRAYDPWPGTFTFWGGRRVKILKTRVAPISASTPGTVVEYSPGIAVGTADSSLVIHSLQLEGKKAQSGEEFARAYPNIIGAVLE
ncbi:MAG: methionyl-tRNA formyltransferase, partial [Candidatus Spechtbacterales bacterium]